MFEGENKPKNVDEFLNELVEETNSLIMNGLSETEIRKGRIIMDSPARSFIFRTKQAGGYFCCHKCQIQGTHIPEHVRFSGPKK